MIIIYSGMIDKEAISKFVESRLGETGYFLVEVKISGDNDIEVVVDSPEGVDIDRCVELSRQIEAEFDRDKEDYSLTVGSAGLTEPFRVRRQYEMHVGDDVEVLAGDGKKYRGTLDTVSDDGFTVLVTEKVREEGAKKPKMVQVPHTFSFTEIKYTKYLLQL